MKTHWDYSDLAEAYLKRPAYAPEALDALFATLQLPVAAAVCDMGAGVAHLTLELLARGFEVVAVEPNDAMRERGQQRSSHFDKLSWHEGTAEASGQPAEHFSAVTFGSSFNVCDQQLALQESARILKPGGWFVCMWNHRDLHDPLQAEIENTIRSLLPGYGYGRRREDQTEVINSSGLFGEVRQLSGRILHQQSPADCITAWRSHATVQRQAGADFDKVIAAIEQVVTAHLQAAGAELLSIPYDTRIWFAQRQG